MPSSRIFTINSNAEVRLELLELTGYKSSYIHIGDLVDHFFPPVASHVLDESYSDFLFWREPMALLPESDEEEDGDDDEEEEDEEEEGEISKVVQRHQSGGFGIPASVTNALDQRTVSHLAGAILKKNENQSRGDDDDDEGFV